MSESMLANVYHGPRDLRVERVPLPEVGPGDLLLKIEVAAVCASDVRVFKGEKKAKPRTRIRGRGGHEREGSGRFLYWRQSHCISCCLLWFLLLLSRGTPEHVCP